MSDCQKCELCKTRRNVVTGRGSLPCDVLFIAGVPGKVEDLLGKPIAGPSGKLFDCLITQAAEAAGVPIPEYYVTYCLACRPCERISSHNIAPTPEQLWACFERLMNDVKRANPLRIVLIGKLAQDHGKQLARGAHPMYDLDFLTESGGVRSPYYMKTMRELSVLFKGVVDAKAKTKTKTKRRLRRRA